MSSYNGVCISGIKNRKLITGVRVIAPGGSSLELSLQDYIDRGIRPDYTELLWCEDLTR
jgi:hypothetical protein